MNSQEFTSQRRRMYNQQYHFLTSRNKKKKKKKQGQVFKIHSFLISQPVAPKRET